MITLVCNLHGSEVYSPPLSLPLRHLDNTGGFNVKCFKCGSTAFSVNHEYRNARTIQIEDNDKTLEDDNADRLEVILYDDASNHVVAGEVVDIGEAYMFSAKLMEETERNCLRYCTATESNIITKKKLSLLQEMLRYLINGKKFVIFHTNEN